MTSKFVLHVDPVKVDRDFKMMDRGQSFHSFNPMVTKLEDLGLNDEKISETIFSSIGGLNYVTYYPDYMNNKSYPKTTPIPCFYCSEPFTAEPIGIPIHFVPSYYKTNVLSKHDQSSVNMNVQINSKLDMKKCEEKQENIVYRDYFQTEGNFCSFPCMLAFLSQHPKDCNQHMIPLLKKYFTSLYGHHIQYNGEKAPDIRLLKKFGGHLTITEFRSQDGRKYRESPNFLFPTFPENVRPSLYVPSAKMFCYHGTKL